MKHLTRCAPYAIYGFSKEMKNAWRKDSKGVTGIVTARAQEAEINESQSGGQIDELFVSLDKNDIPRSISIIDSFGQVRNRQAVEPLTILLDDPDESIRLHSAQALGNIGDTKAVVALEEMKVPDRDSALNMARLKAIEQINLKNM